MQTGRYRPVMDQGDEGLEPEVDLDGLYDTEAVDHFVYGDEEGPESASESFGEYWQDGRPDDEVELFEETFEEVIDDVESYMEDPEEMPEEGLTYVGLDEESGEMVRYDVEMDEDGYYADLAVNFMSMGSGLFGFTVPGSDSVQINDALYEVDEESTIRHEKTHHEHPGKDELTIRYINGDIDPENTITGSRELGSPRSWAYNPAEESFADDTY